MSFFSGLCDFLSQLASFVGGFPILGGLFAFIVNGFRTFPLLGCQ